MVNVVIIKLFRCLRIAFYYYATQKGGCDVERVCSTVFSFESNSRLRPRQKMEEGEARREPKDEELTY